MNKLLRVLLALSVGLLVAACSVGPGASPSPSSPPSAGPGMVDAVGDWQLIRGTVDGVDIPLMADSPVTMTVEGSRVSGRAACNQYGGEIVVADGEVRFGALMQTEMACEEPLMSIESAFLGAMSRVRAAAAQDDGLTLSGPGVELAFERLSA